MLIGEALKAQGALSLAEGYYQKAVDEGSFKASTEAVFQLGECQRRLGLINESRYTFAGIDTSSPYTAQALRKLAEIDLAQRNFEGVLTWLEEGRETYPGEFSDGWSSYALVSALIALNRLDNAEAELTSFRVKHSDTDSWFVLAQAGLEAAYAREINTKTPPAAINSIQEEKVLP
ncbi:MAG TPA: hypothetical protein PLP17_01080, partial [Oligoflexia bacterium]|nr:hypothetical protein [Oligoflexia bacterium]